MPWRSANPTEVSVRSNLLAYLFLTISLAALPSCGRGSAESTLTEAEEKAGLVVVSIETRAGPTHAFKVETASTVPQQQRGLMFRRDIPENGGMLFHPYPPDGTGPREASFWMKDTPTSLDIVYIRADGTIARIAARTTPFSEEPIPSGEPVAAVLELRAGRSAALGIAPGDRVRFDGLGS